MLSFRRFLIESVRYSLLLEDKRTEFVNRYMNHHREHRLVQQDPKRARELIAHSLQFGQNPEEHKFITRQLLDGRYKPGEDDPTIQATLGNWRKLTRETRGMHQGKTLADHDHDSVSALFRASSGEIKSSKAKISAGDLAKYHIGTIDGGEHGPLDVYHIHQDMVPEGEDVQEETVRIQGREQKFYTEKPYIDFSKAIKRVCPPGSTICVQHAGAHVKSYADGHGFFLYTNQNGQTVYAHGYADDGIKRNDNSTVREQEAQNIKDQTGNLLSGKRKADYALMAGGEDGILPDIKLTDEEFHSAITAKDYGSSSALDHHFTPDRFEKAFSDPNPIARRTAILSEYFLKEKKHVEKALSDPDLEVRYTAIRSVRHSPELYERIFNDQREHPFLREAALGYLNLHHPEHFTRELFTRAFSDLEPEIREFAVKTGQFGPQDMHVALSDEDYRVRLAAVKSKHFGPKHLKIALNDPHEAVVRFAKNISEDW